MKALTTNWKTTVFGFLAGATQIAAVLSQSGFSFGHCGNSDCLKLGAGVLTMLLGAFAKDHNVTGGTTTSQ